MAGEVRPNHNILGEPVDDQLFRHLAENLPALCWIADASGYISWYNPRWYQYTGTTPSQMEGWGWQSVHDPKNLAPVLEKWSEAISSAHPFEMVFPIRGADGVYRPFLTRINPAFDLEGNVTHWFGVNTDISLIRVSTADMLNALGFSVRETSSAEMALAAIDEGLMPELLITDHLMPGMTGVQLARLVRERRPITKTLIISGFAEVDGIDPSFPRLTKPFVQSELEAAIASLQHL